jgi:hypothetical protein
MKFELELDDKGEFVGTVPPEFTGVLDKIRSTAHGEGFGKGNQKAAEEAKAQIASTIAAEKAKWDANLPLERAKWADIEAQNGHLTKQLEASVTSSRKNLTEVQEAHAQEITRRVERETKRDARIKTLVNQTLRGLASQAGARDESLGELEVILQHRIGYNDDMEPFVKNEDGSEAKTTAGNPLGLDVFVKQYLDNHPHHRKPVAGRGGDARGGASLRGGGQPSGTVQQITERIQNGDRGAGAINELFEATRAKRAS